jgi:hypothetical protein
VAWVIGAEGVGPDRLDQVVEVGDGGVQSSCRFGVADEPGNRLQL